MSNLAKAHRAISALISEGNVLSCHDVSDGGVLVAAAEMCIVLPKGRPAALAYVSEFVEQSKKSGMVQRAIETAKLRGVRVAP